MTPQEIFDAVFDEVRPVKNSNEYSLAYNRKARVVLLTNFINDDELNRWLLAAYFYGFVKLDTLREIMPIWGTVSEFVTTGIKDIYFTKSLTVRHRNELKGLVEVAKEFPEWSSFKRLGV